MRLLRYGPPGREKPGLADKDGNIRDLSKVITQIDDAMLAPRNLARLARVKPETLPVVRGNPRLGVPYAGISKFVAIGLNYSDHAQEAGMPIPKEPIIFMKPTSARTLVHASVALASSRSKKRSSLPRNLCKENIKAVTNRHLALRSQGFSLDQT